MLKLNVTKLLIYVVGQLRAIAQNYFVALSTVHGDGLISNKFSSICFESRTTYMYM